MNSATQRSIFRWIHIIFSIPILGYIYSRFEKLPVNIPTQAKSGLEWATRRFDRRIVSAMK